MPEESQGKRVLGRDEPGVFDHDLETLGSIKAYGGGLNRFSGPATFEKWLEIPHRSADPTAWGTNERGRTWFDASNDLFKFWDGTQIIVLANYAPGVIGLETGAIAFGDANDYITSDVDNLFWDDSNNFLGVGFGVPVCRVHIRGAECADYTGLNPDVYLLIENDDNVVIQLQAATDGEARIVFVDDNYNPPAGGITYDFADDEMDFTVVTNHGMRLDAVGLCVNKTLTGATNPLTVWQVGTEAGYGTYGGVVARFRANEGKHTAIAIDARTSYDPILAFSTNGFCIWDMRFDNSDVNQLQIRYQGGEGNFDNLTVFEILSAGSVRIPASYLGIMSKNELRFYDDSTNYVGFEAPELTGDQIWVLPQADGAAGEVLSTSGAGVLSWIVAADVKVAVDSGATADYLGAASNDGALRTDGTQITLADGGNFITLTTAQAIDATASPTFVGLTLSGATYLYGDVYTDRWLNLDHNTFLGVNVAGTDALAHTTANEGYHNTAFGYEAMKAITKGYMNAALGSQCLLSLTTGYYNVAIGAFALWKTDTGMKNMAIGGNALLNNEDGYMNMAVGFGALENNVSGQYNVGIGTGALAKNLSSGNIGIGQLAGSENANGWSNVNIGYEAGRLATVPYLCVYIGSQAGWNNLGNNNVGIGYRAMYGTGASGVNNTVIGVTAAAYSSTTASGNVIIGFEGGYGITSGGGNVLIGNQVAKTRITTQSNLLYISNTDTATPLIYGEFPNTLLKLNADVHIPGKHLILPKTTGHGVKVDTVTPTFPWHDILGQVSNRNTGASKPTLATYRDTLVDFQFSAGDEEYINFHLPHDYVAGTDIYLHVHWSHTGAFVTGGTVTFGYELSYAKAYNQAPFPASVSGTITGTPSTTQYQHILSELVVSDSAPGAGELDTDDLEVDGIVIARIDLTSNDLTVSEGAVPDPFIHYVDIHYQSTGIGTKDKNSPFYT